MEFGEYILALRLGLFTHYLSYGDNRVGSWEGFYSRNSNISMKVRPHRRGESRNDAISRALVYLLRHGPEQQGAEVDTTGWATLDHLISKSTKLQRLKPRREDIEAIINGRDAVKLRLQCSTDQTGVVRVRALQGHGGNRERTSASIKTTPFYPSLAG